MMGQVTVATAGALLEHLQAERARTVALWQHFYGAAWATPEREARLAGYGQAIIDGEEWLTAGGGAVRDPGGQEDEP